MAEDAGRLINPMIVDGQIHGGVAQGIANALLEEIIYDETGNILTATLADYLPPTAREIPPIEIHHLETLTDASLTKAKGLGEGGAIGRPPPSSTPSTTPYRRSAYRSMSSRQPRSASARRYVRLPRGHKA